MAGAAMSPFPTPYNADPTVVWVIFMSPGGSILPKSALGLAFAPELGLDPRL